MLMHFLKSRYTIPFHYASIHDPSNFRAHRRDSISFDFRIEGETRSAEGGDNTFRKLSAERAIASISNIYSHNSARAPCVPSRRKETIRNNLVPRHPKITISFAPAIITLARKTGFSIPVSETKILGSRETAGEVSRRARRYLVDKLDRISRIPLRISTRSRIWSATAMQQGDAAPRATRLCTALICISQLRRENADGKKKML